MMIKSIRSHNGLRLDLDSRLDFWKSTGNLPRLYRILKERYQVFHKITGFAQNIASHCCKGTVHFFMVTWYRCKLTTFTTKQRKQKCHHFSKEPIAKIVSLSLTDKKKVKSLPNRNKLTFLYQKQIFQNPLRVGYISSFWMRKIFQNE